MKTRIWVILLLLIAAAAAFFFLRREPATEPATHQPAAETGRPEIQGSITFHSNGTAQKVDVEVARSEYEHAKGLMDRTSLPHHQGMLFIFDEMAPRSFWMRNTRISLDIIYVDDKKKVVSIQKNAVPMSDESLPSTGPAQYVVEVNAGFADLYKIQPGDSLSFNIPK
ncbi:hypothetical protein GCM10023091_09140 [Ravibacter arvi]|uniref:DUF192 domain-containing protein n=1 Tax=Ravibacter arvi TaxID=2051041 RepID=A0ABP8LTW8_9BACT